jgi:cytochrome c-type biogenesis protein
MGAAVLSFLAGTLSVLSPCVLPLLPIIVAAALQEHRHGPLVLAGGLIVTSTVTGLFFASLGFTTGVDRDAARAGAAALMAIAGLILLVPQLQTAFARLASPLATAAEGLTTRLPAGLGGQLLLGALLGFVWTPCTGPTLAAAITLATRSESLVRAGTVMLVFSIGAVVPLLILAYVSRRAARGRRATLTRLAVIGKPVMGVMLLVVGALALTGADKRIEAWMVDHMPTWLLGLTTAL